MAIDELTRVCICHALITDPSATVCGSCARILVPHYTTWPAAMRWWLLSELAARRFYTWLTPQQVWEQLLRDAMVSTAGSAFPNPRGVQYTTSTPAADLYPRALQLASEWKAAGSPIAVRVDLARRSA
ncbi:MAG TPA: hypothetical protein VHB25_12175 [Gemmatimonadaceae bacterium]|nr:hypothetical protein [Gemmatimonadaceae bacterium]